MKPISITILRHLKIKRALRNINQMFSFDSASHQIDSSKQFSFINKQHSDNSEFSNRFFYFFSWYFLCMIVCS